MRSSDYFLPPPLKKGDTLAYFSPSSPATHFAPKRYERARNYLEDKGWNLVSGKLSGQADYYRSGSIQDRANELNELIRNPDIRCIMSTIGGSNSNALLPYIDYQALQRDPKIIIGYSDMTAILLAIYQRIGLITFYGPALVASFGEFPPFVDQTYQYFADLLTARKQKSFSYTLPQIWTDERIDWESQVKSKTAYENQCEFMGKGRFTGRLIGGNLNTMWSIWGSPYMPEILEGDILLIEDSLKSIATVERLFAFLKLNGIFDRVAAVILGKHELFNDAGSGRQPIDVLKEVLNGQDLPIVNGFDCCHTHPMLTMPIGLQICADFDQKQITLIEPWITDI